MHNKNGSAVLLVIILILILAVAVLGYFFIKTQPTKEISTAPTETTTTTSPSPTPTAASKAVIVFEGEGSFSQTEKDEIYNKVINPYIDYYAELPDQILLTMTIAKNLQANKDAYPYSVKTIFNNGVNAGFLIIKEGTVISWWLPECMGSCNLSTSFKAKYPEIASKAQ